MQTQTPTPSALFGHFRDKSYVTPGTLEVLELTIGKARFLAARFGRTSPANLSDYLVVFGDKPKEIATGRRLLHLPGDAREWYLSGWFSVKAQGNTPKADLERFLIAHPFGSEFALGPVELPKDDEERDRYEHAWPDGKSKRAYKRIVVSSLQRWRPTDGTWMDVKDTPEITAKRPWPFPAYVPQHHIINEVEGEGQTLYLQYEPKTALCVAVAQSHGEFDVDKAVEVYSRNIRMDGTSRYALEGFSTPTGDNFAWRADSQKPQEVTLAELLSYMHRSVHSKILARLDKAIGFVLYENLDMSSSSLGAKSVFPVGPEWTNKDFDNLVPYVNDLPSQRQYLRYWARIPTVPAGT